MTVNSKLRWKEQSHAIKRMYVRQYLCILKLLERIDIWRSPSTGSSSSSTNSCLPPRHRHLCLGRGSASCSAPTPSFYLLPLPPPAPSSSSFEIPHRIIVERHIRGMAELFTQGLPSFLSPWLDHHLELLTSFRAWLLCS